jgi:hypothetical protein
MGGSGGRLLDMTLLAASLWGLLMSIGILMHKYDEHAGNTELRFVFVMLIVECMFILAYGCVLVARGWVADEKFISLHQFI